MFLQHLLVQHNIIGLINLPKNMPAATKINNNPPNSPSNNNFKLDCSATNASMPWNGNKYKNKI